MRGFLFVLLLLSGLLTVYDLPLLAQENSPSMEDMESLPDRLEEVPAQPVESPQVPKSMSVPSAEYININDKINKVIEPQLFSGAIPAIYSRKKLNVVGKRLELNPGEAPDEYEVQEGDTLYDICDQLLDDSDYWPKLWSLNPEVGMGIVNPHFIYPGMRLRFRSEGVPSLVIAEATQTTPTPQQGLTPRELVREPLNGVPVLESFSHTPKVIDSLENIAGFGDMFLDVGGAGRVGAIQLLLPGVVVEEEDAMKPLGEVIGGSSGSVLVDRGEELIIEPEDKLDVGRVYSVFRRIGKVYTTNEGDYAGFKYEFVAHLKVNSQNEQEEIYRGSVVLNRTGVQPGDLIFPFRTVKRSVPLGRMASSKGQGQEVIGFEDVGMQIGGRGSLVYLHQEDGQKLAVGQTYQIEQNIKKISSELMRKRLPETFKTIAEVYVIDATERAALAYVVSDESAIRLGDRIVR